MRRALLLLGLVAVLAGGGFLVHELRTPADDARAIASSREDKAPGGARSATAVTPPDVKTVADVDKVLARIEGTARSSGVVSLEEIELGHAAILALSSTLGRDATLAKGRRFDETMRRLQQDREMQPTQDELKRLAADITAKTDRLARERLVAQYRRTAQQLPAAYRAEAMARLALSQSSSTSTSRRP